MFVKYLKTSVLHNRALHFCMSMLPHRRRRRPVRPLRRIPAGETRLTVFPVTCRCFYGTGPGYREQDGKLCKCGTHWYVSSELLSFSDDLQVYITEGKEMFK